MKKLKRVVLAGGNGYLGGVLAKYYSLISDEVILLSRKQKMASGNITTLTWDGETAGQWTNALEGADIIINLCGKNVNCRYTKTNKEEIIQSRITPTKLLGETIAKMQHPPKLWINITSATIYRHAEDRPQDEKNGDIGQGFSVDVCRLWEDSFFESKTPQTRKIALRMGIVLGIADSAFPRLLNLVRFGLGGRQGDGQQYMSWIHELDAARCTEWLWDNKNLKGIINCTSAKPVKNNEFMAFLRKAMGVRFGLPSPAWLLNIGAFVIGTETELILKSRWVLPTRLVESGFRFFFNTPQAAIEDLVNNHNR